MKILMILAGIIGAGGVATCIAFLFGILGFKGVMDFLQSQDKGGD